MGAYVGHGVGRFVIILSCRHKVTVGELLSRSLTL